MYAFWLSCTWQPIWLVPLKIAFNVSRLKPTLNWNQFWGIWDTVQIHLIRTQVIQTKLKWICLTLFFSRKGQILNLFYATRNVRYTEERKANHKNFSSEPHYPHFLIRATSIFSSFPLIEILIWRLITRPWEFVYKYF